MSNDAVKPLQNLLDAFNVRLARVEAQLGMDGAQVPARVVGAASASAAVDVDLSPQLKAYDEYVAQSLPPFLDVSKKLGNDTNKLAIVTERRLRLSARTC